MPHLNPNESFPIVRVLENHTDTDTNYVQAVIRDASTDAVLATVNLTDLGSRRFSKVWKVPYDNVFAIGRWIIITTTIYTDSGYTTKNPNYAEKGDTYLIQERWNSLKFGIVGQNAGVDYKELRKLIKEELAAMPVNDLEPVELPTAPDLTPHLKSITDSVAQLGAKVDAIKIPEPETPEPIDLMPLTSRLDALLKTLNALPKFKETNLSPILQTLTDELRTMKNTIITHVEAQAAPKSYTLTPSGEDNQLGKRATYLRGLATKHRVV